MFWEICALWFLFVYTASAAIKAFVSWKTATIDPSKMLRDMLPAMTEGIQDGINAMDPREPAQLIELNAAEMNAQLEAAETDEERAQVLKRLWRPGADPE